MSISTRRLAAGMMLVLTAACGSDTSTGPKAPTVSAQDALRSLTASIASSALPGASVVDGSAFNTFTPDLVRQITVTIDGSAVQMFALALQTTYPVGTCLEQLAPANTASAPVGPTCTPPPQGLTFILWQTGSATAVPDRLIIVYANPGAATLSDLSLTDGNLSSGFPSFAIYTDRTGALMFSSSGTLTTSVSNSGQSCSFVAPAFATSGTCSRATFNVSGHVVFSDVTLSGAGASGSHTMDLPGTSVAGIVENFIGIKP